VSAERDAAPDSERMLAFEVANNVYALPIEAVLEVAEADRATCVPGVPPEAAGVMNWHGDPLPLVSTELLLGIDESAEETDAHQALEPVLRGQVLVLSDRGDESARLGMPVDRVVGLIEGGAGTGRATRVVAERRSVDGRVVAVICPRMLVDRAGEIIERAAQ